MYVVAVCRWGKPVEQELGELAALLGGTAYDLRLRLMGPLPVLVDQSPDRQAAEALLDALRRRGHGVVLCDTDEVYSSDQMIAPRKFGFENEALVLEFKQPVRVAYEQIMVLVLGTRATAQQTTTTKAKRKFSIGRAALSGGLMSRRKVSKHSTSYEEEREQVLYIFARGGISPIIMTEFGLHYSSLGEFMCPSTSENFMAVVAILRERAHNAAFDDCLAGVTRKPSLVGVGGGASQRVTTSSNASELDLLAHLLVKAHIEKQL